MTPPDAPQGAGITLGQFLKQANLAATGGEAKRLIQGGQVQVNGVVETRRARQLHPGDEVRVRQGTPRRVEAPSLRAQDTGPGVNRHQA